MRDEEFDLGETFMGSLPENGMHEGNAIEKGIGESDTPRSLHLEQRADAELQPLNINS